MPRNAHYIAVYDVTADSERQRVAAVLGGFGFRVQKSVFELRLTRGQREHLLRLLQRAKPSTGCISIYRLSNPVIRTDLGIPPHRPFDESKHAFVI